MREGKTTGAGAGKSGKGFSLRSSAAIDVGLFSSGPATIKESIFTEFSYKGAAKPVPVWLITFSREGEEDYEQPYGIGKGWKISADGTELVPKNGQTGLGKTCNAMLYLIKPLEAALEAADLDPDEFLAGDPTALEGLSVVVARVDQVERENQKKREDGSPRTILVIETIAKKGKKAASKAKGNAADDEDDAPAKKKGKGSADADDDLLEEGVEALIAALETADGPIKLADLDDALDVELKGNKNRKAIIALMTDEDVLANEKGWTFNEKKKVLTLDA